ncbi:MAG: menaquinone C8-methyltransferase [Kosmotoga sp.]|nr:menaquinone C8-methyltransferase [Kosmotoga sp.]
MFSLWVYLAKCIVWDFGRDHSARDNYLALKNALDLDFDFVDVDVVFDPLRFSDKVAHADLENVMRLSPQQISVYPMMRFSYTKFKGTRNRSRRELKVFDTLDEIADKNGYRRDTLWTYVRKDLKKRYTSVAREFYLGLGLSASTFTGYVFATNTFSLARYRENLERRKLPIGSLFHLSAFQGALYYSFWSLYTGQLDFNSLIRYFPKSRKKLRLLLESLRFRGYLTKRNELYLLTHKGRKKLHQLEEWLTYAYIDPLWRQLRSEGTQNLI